MKQTIIDIGSNSIRLTLYETEGEHFKTLFREKIMADSPDMWRTGHSARRGSNVPAPLS